MSVGEVYLDPASYEAAVVPRYAARFAEPLLRALELGQARNVLDLFGRTGALTRELLARAPHAQVAAIDPDPGFAMELRGRAGTDPRLVVAAASVAALPFDDEAFTHVAGNLIDRASGNRAALLAEAARVCAPGAQLALSMPLRGSFVEVLDMFREVALKYELGGVAERVERFAESLPTVEQWREEVAAAGFSRVEVAQDCVFIDLADDLYADPVCAVAVLPELRWCAAGALDAGAVLARVRETIDTYFRGRLFGFSVFAGCASARRPGR